MYDISNQPEEMQKRYKALPPEIIELFEFGTVDVVLDKITKGFQLTSDQKAMLRVEIELTLYFFFPRTNIIERIQESLEIDRLKAENIAADVENQLFIIVDDMLSFAETQFNGEGENQEIPSLNPNQNTTPITVPTMSANPLPSVIPTFVTPPPITPAQPVTPEVQPTPKVPTTNVKPIRTFANDVELSRAHSYGAFRGRDEDTTEEPAHQSNQDDILKK